MVRILDGRAAADRILSRLAAAIRRRHRHPVLATILVGDRFDSDLYVRLKTKAAARVGINTLPYQLPSTVSQAALHRLIQRLNRQRKVDGILLQLPLPKQLNADLAVNQIHPGKDVDGFHPANRRVVPPPVAAVLELLRLAKVSRPRLAMILAKPSVFTQRLTEELERRGFQVVTEHPIKRIPSRTKQAAVIITALGRGPRLRAQHIQPGATVIDVGTRRRGKQVVGDADPSVRNRAAALSPVPGGVGPLTIAFVLKNTYQLSQPL